LAEVAEQFLIEHVEAKRTVFFAFTGIFISSAKDALAGPHPPAPALRSDQI
jgi:hypothetical protein